MATGKFGSDLDAIAYASIAQATDLLTICDVNGDDAGTGPEDKKIAVVEFIKRTLAGADITWMTALANFAAITAADDKLAVWDASATAWKPISISEILNKTLGGTSISGITALANLAAVAPADDYFPIWDASAVSWKVLKAQELSTRLFNGTAINPRDPTYGAVGDGSANDTTALQAACTAAGAASPILDVIIPPGIYQCQGLVVPDGVTVYGFGDATVIRKRSNGFVVQLGTDANLINLSILGAGATYTGVGVTIPATVEFEGGQRITNCRIEDTASYAVEYSAEYAGYGSVILSCVLKPTSVSTYSVKWGEETASNHHGDRSIIGCNSAYNPLVNASGSQAGLVMGNIVGGLGVKGVLFNSSSAKVVVTGNRFGSTGATDVIDGTSHTWSNNISAGNLTVASTGTSCTISGNIGQAFTLTSGGDGNTVSNNTCTTLTVGSDTNTIVGNRGTGAFTISSGADNNSFSANYCAALSVSGGGNSVTGNVCTTLTVAGNNNAVSGNKGSGALSISSGATGNVVTGNYASSHADSSGSTGSSANSIDIPLTAYTPTWTASGTAPALGDGTITGRYVRHGRIVTATVTVNMGSTTTFGTGTYYFSLPFLPTTTEFSIGSARLLDSGVAHYVGITQTLLSGAARMEVYANNTGGPVGATVPFTWANGDTLVASITYSM